MRSRARSATFKPGVLRSPEAPTTHAHNVIGSDHDRDARTRRAVPIRLDATPIKGTATCSGRTPAPDDARLSQFCQSIVRTSVGNSGSSPRRSSRTDQSGSFQSWIAGGSIIGLDGSSWNLHGWGRAAAPHKWSCRKRFENEGAKENTHYVSKPLFRPHLRLSCC